MKRDCKVILCQICDYHILNLSQGVGILDYVVVFHGEIPLDTLVSRVLERERATLETCVVVFGCSWLGTSRERVILYVSSKGESRHQFNIANRIQLFVLQGERTYELTLIRNS